MPATRQVGMASGLLEQQLAGNSSEVFAMWTLNRACDPPGGHGVGAGGAAAGRGQLRSLCNVDTQPCLRSARWAWHRSWWRSSWPGTAQKSLQCGHLTEPAIRQVGMASGLVAQQLAGYSSEVFAMWMLSCA